MSNSTDSSTVIKYEGYDSSHLSVYDLLGSKEVALTKMLAYILSNNRTALRVFLRFITVNVPQGKKWFTDTKVEIEKRHYHHNNKKKHDRTDLEIYCKSKFHIICESKVRKNKVLDQLDRYEEYLDKKCEYKLMCSVSHNTSSRINQKGTVVEHILWSRLINLFNTRKFTQDNIIKDFRRFYMSNFHFKDVGEILVQDVSVKTEIERITKQRVYRRDETFGDVLYFAPYFTKSALKQKTQDVEIKEGISQLYRVLKVLTLNPSEVGKTKETVEKILENCLDAECFKEGKQEKVKNWLEGFAKDQEKKYYTYYFLDGPITHSPIMKKGNNKILGPQIPKNRCITFSDYMKLLLNSSANDG